MKSYYIKYNGIGLTLHITCPYLLFPASIAIDIPFNTYMLLWWIIPCNFTLFIRPWFWGQCSSAWLSNYQYFSGSLRAEQIT